MSEGSCLCCGHACETVLHVLQDCHFARCVWTAVWSRASSLKFFHMSYVDWVVHGNTWVEFILGRTFFLHTLSYDFVFMEVAK